MNNKYGAVCKRRKINVVIDLANNVADTLTSKTN